MRPRMPAGPSRPGDRRPATVAALALGGAVLAGACLVQTLLIRHLADRRRRALARTRENERTRLSRDLHDLVAHHVTGIVVVAREARHETDARRLGELLSAIEGAGRDALWESRRLVSRLRAAAPADGLAGGVELATLVRAFEATGAAASVGVRLPQRLDDPVTAALVRRVVREALTNIQRHAYGTQRVEVSVDDIGDTVRVSVADVGVAGVSAPFALGTGTGLVGLRERLEAVGGTLDSGATERGWRVRAHIPARMPTAGRSSHERAEALRHSS